MRSFKEYNSTKHGFFNGRILIIGYGSVGQAILPLILRHIDIDPKNITVLEKDDNKKVFTKRHGKTPIKYVRFEITQQNYKKELAKYVGQGDLIVNCSLNIDAEPLLIWCAENGVMQIDTSLERWPHIQDEKIPKLGERTLWHTHQDLREKMEPYKNGPTLCVTHGANPGYVNHLTKRALLLLAKEKKKKIDTPTSREEWAQLMKMLGVKVVHIAERDTQIIDEPKLKNEFANTWSCEGFWAEGRAPSEMGWGTHEDAKPVNGDVQGNTAYLNQPGAAVLIKSWVPAGGQYNGFCIQHSESVTISDYFTTEKGDFRPSVYYVYQPCDAAIASLHEMRGNELNLQYKQRILKDEIIAGIDELGVLLIGNDFAFWHGSQMSIDDARKLVPGESATSIQVAGSMLGAIVWMLQNPRQGYKEPDELPFDMILEIGDPYWEPLASEMIDWVPNQDKQSLFYQKYDKSNPCKFENFRVWT